MNKNKFRRDRPLFSTPVPRAVKEPKIRWKVLPLIWAAVKRTCFVIGALVLISALTGIFLAGQFVEEAAPSLPQEMVLTYRLEEGLYDSPRQAAMADPFARSALTAQELVEALYNAAQDGRVKGFLLRMDSTSLSVGHIRELRAAVKSFRDSGKFAHVYAPSLGGMGNAIGAYYLASAFDEIWMQPMGVLSISGFAAEMPYLRGALDKLGIVPEFFKREDYKTAYEAITDRQISPQNREMIGRLLQDYKTVFWSDIAEDRGITIEAFDAYVDQALLTAEEALAAGLIDYSDYPDTLIDRTEETYGEDIAFAGLVRYGRLRKKELSHKRLLQRGFKGAGGDIALVHIDGAIMQEDPGVQAPIFMGGAVAASNEIVPILYDIAEDTAISAVVLRVNSPGGSPVASEAILRGVRKIQESGKPVIVSMGDMAASGGYWVAALADHIVAYPTSITGSIGVVGGKFALEGMWPSLGVNWDSVTIGDKAGMWSPNDTFSVAEGERVNAMLDQIYNGFIARVAEGRAMSEEQVRAIAGGRVWSGQRALEIGLVDQVGTFNDALDYTAQLLGLQDRAALNVMVLPAPKSPFEILLNILEGQVIAGRVASVQGRLLESFAPAFKSATISGEMSRQGERAAALIDPFSVR